MTKNQPFLLLHKDLHSEEIRTDIIDTDDDELDLSVYEPPRKKRKLFHHSDTDNYSTQGPTPTQETRQNPPQGNFNIDFNVEWVNVQNDINQMSKYVSNAVQDFLFPFFV